MIHKCATKGCGETNRKEFWKDNRKGPGGLQTYCKACSKARREAWGKDNKDKVTKYIQKSKKNPRAVKREAKPKHIYDQVAMNNYRAKQLNPNAGVIKTREWEVLLMSHLDGCPDCQRPWALAGAPTMDHIKPLADGGKNHIRNIQPLCRSCNVRKHKKYKLLKAKKARYAAE